ncbi:31033_t:CDS:2, partial [Racocetra persica]
KLNTDIEALNFQNIIDLKEYINYLEKGIYIIDEDDNTEMRLITHHEALNTIELIKQYIIQQDFNNKTLLKLQREVKKFQNAAFKQTNIETYFTPEI